MRPWRGMWGRISMVIETDGGFWLILGLMVLLFPVRVLAGILLAAAIHEAGHILAVRLCGGRINRIRLHIGGAELIAAPLSPGRELLCILAGPAAGALTVLAWRIFPELAVAGLLQTAFNLLPLPNLDGGRALRNICCKLRRFGVQWLS